MLLLFALLACHPDPQDTAPIPVCETPTPPAEATLRLGQDPQTVLLPNGRVLTPVGVQVQLETQLGSIALDPAGRFAYVSGINRRTRTLSVVDLQAGALVQDLERDDAWFGLAMTDDGWRLYASGGRSGDIDVYDVGSDGLLTWADSWFVEGYPAGLALSDDEQHLYVARYGETDVTTVETATGAILGATEIGLHPFSIVKVPGKSEVWAAAISSSRIAVFDPETGVVSATFDAVSDPEGLVVSPDGGTVYAALSNTDLVVAWDVETLAPLATASLAHDLAGPDGTPLPAVGPNALALDAEAGVLYVARSADNAVSLLDADSLALLGTFPVGWYPDDLAVAPDGTVVVANMKGTGAGPNLNPDSTPETIEGTVSIVDVAALDLAATTAQVEDNLRRPDDVYPFPCAGTFPVPPRWGEPSAVIEHVVLIVRENKTYDVLLGDYPGSEGDPEGAYLAPYVPNLHALADRFGVNDNFYTDSEVSTQGHLWLTQVWVNDFMEKSWMEDYHGGGDFTTDPVLPAATPGYGSFFAHLIHHDVDFTILGEIVGVFDEVDGETVMEHLDGGYPGVFFDLSTQDTERAAWAAEELFGADGQGGHFPPFVYMLLPDDHTRGGTDPTPEAMIADNDAATGYFIDKLSRSTYWDSTVVFVVEDDPQQGTDHIDTHRSFCLVASPYSRRGHVSQVLTSFPSVYKTIELILGLPPMNRFDAMATPMWDAFTAEADLTPFDALPAAIPWHDENTVRRPDPAPALTAAMDFSGPDRAPLLGEWLWWYFHGRPRPGSVLARWAAGDLKAIEGLEGDDDGDDEIYEASYRRLRRWMAEHPDRGWDFAVPAPLEDEED